MPEAPNPKLREVPLPAGPAGRSRHGAVVVEL